MGEPCTIVIGAEALLPALKTRFEDSGTVLAFSDEEALRALDAINARRPTIVALERLFASTSRGAALINRIKADPTLDHCEIHVIAHDTDYLRVSRRANGGDPASGPHRAAAPPSGSHRVASPESGPHSAAPASGPHAVAAPASGSGPHAVAAPADQSGPHAVAVQPAPKTGKPPIDYRGTRRAPRQRMRERVEVLVDGNPALLIDLSIYGAQVLSPTVLRPNQRVRVSLPDEHGAVRFNGSIAWAAFELSQANPTPQYRAGVDFTDADRKAVDVFLGRHRRD